MGHSNNMHNRHLPQMISFPLPFRSAPRNFKDPLLKTAAKNPRNHIAFASADRGGVLRPLSPLSVASLCEKFGGNCVILKSNYHKASRASDIPVQRL